MKLKSKRIIRGARGVFLSFVFILVLGSVIYGIKWFFALAPNIFEHFYLFWVAKISFFNKFKLTALRLFVILFIVGVPKIIQEYYMHFKYPDQTWAYIRDYFFFWFY